MDSAPDKRRRRMQILFAILLVTPLLIVIGLVAADRASRSSPAEAGPPDGERLYTQLACAACHSVDGSPRTAPTFKGLYGSQKKMADGSVVHVDDAYLREAILTPNVRLVEGFGPVMPAYEGRLSDAQVQALLDFIKKQR